MCYKRVQLFLKLKSPIKNFKCFIVFHNKKFVFFVEGLFTQHQSNLESMAPTKCIMSLLYDISFNRYKDSRNQL